MIKCIILDGFFQGTVVNHDGNPILRMAKPRTNTICDCNPEIRDEIISEERVLDYFLAAKGQDCFIYTLSGKLFDELTRHRDWVVEPEFHGRRSPIYFRCRDERAFL